jgi:pimeloyl-[acyl-carrier protein] methyl ester esterase
MTHLVVLPGLDGTATMHGDFVDAVRPSFETVSVIAYPSDQILPYSELEALVRDSLPEGRFVLLGESFSGPIAISIAATQPRGLAGLVLSTSFARKPAPLLSGFAAFVAFAPVRTLPEWMLSYVLLGPWRTPELMSSLQHTLEGVAPEVLRARVAAAMRIDVSSRVAEINLPILYLRATNDRLMPSAASREIASRAKNVSLVDIRGPHLLLQTAPQACAQAVAEFAARLG